MGAGLDPGRLNDVFKGKLLFTPQQGELIRAALLTQTAQR